MMEKYLSDQILRVAIPQWRRAPDGLWSRDWRVRLVNPPDTEAQRALCDLSDESVRVVANIEEDGRTIHLQTTTNRDALTDEIFLIAAYRMLCRIDEDVGCIASIQGQPREWWQPFRIASS